MPESKSTKMANTQGVSLVASWRDAGRRLQHIFLAFLFCGTSLAILGLLGDNEGWWDSRPFLINFVSSSAAACFGIPFALLVFRYLQLAHQARAEAIKGLRLILAATSESLDEIMSEHLMVKLRSRLRETFEAYAVADSAADGNSSRQWRGVAGNIGLLWRDWRPDEDLNSRIREMKEVWKGAYDNAGRRIADAGLPSLQNEKLQKVNQCFNDLWEAVSSANLEGRYNALEGSLRGSRITNVDMKAFLVRYEKVVTRLDQLRLALKAASSATH